MKYEIIRLNEDMLRVVEKDDEGNVTRQVTGDNNRRALLTLARQMWCREAITDEEREEIASAIQALPLEG